MSSITLSKLVQVPLRDVWKHEAQHFTQWLAMPENLEYLNDAIGLDLANVQTEVGVGPFFVDILAEDEGGESFRRIIVENQLEPTNHDHLGKIITYAAGLQAEVVVWIVEKARQEHEQAINWLNEHTDADTNFFLIQVEAWRIGNSDPAPRFNIIARPNDWAKAVKETAGGRKRSELNLQQQAFFERLMEYGEVHAKSIKSWQKPRPQHWYTIRIGSSQAQISAVLNSTAKYVGVEFYIRNNKGLFSKLHGQKFQIENELGYPLDWQELPNKKASRIIVIKAGDFQDESQTDELIRWAVETINQFALVFPKYLK